MLGIEPRAHICETNALPQSNSRPSEERPSMRQSCAVSLHPSLPLATGHTQWQSHKIVWPSDSIAALVHVMYADVRPMTTYTLRMDSYRLAMYYCFPGGLFGRQRSVGKGNSGRDSRARQRDVCMPNAITHQLSNLGKQLHSSEPPFHPLLV